MNDDGDDGYNPNEMKLKANKLAQAVADAAEDKDTEEVLNEFNFLSNQSGTDSVDGVKSSGATSDDGKGRSVLVTFRQLSRIVAYLGE